MSSISRENHAYEAGIRTAGFALVAELSFDREGTPVVKEIRAGGGEAAAVANSPAS